MREAQPGVLLQILDREQDIDAVLDDLAEQPAQGVAALVQHTGCIQDSAVDAAALEDADILQRYAVGGKQVVASSSMVSMPPSSSMAASRAPQRPQR